MESLGERFLRVIESEQKHQASYSRPFPAWMPDTSPLSFIVSMRRVSEKMEELWSQPNLSKGKIEDGVRILAALSLRYFELYGVRERPNAWSSTFWP